MNNTQVDYKSEVLKLFPRAQCNDVSMYYGKEYFIFDFAQRSTITVFSFATPSEAWKVAYEHLKSEGKL